MNIALDVAYFGSTGFGVGVAFDAWTDAAPRSVVSATIDPVAAYEPGAFYKRELPVLLAVLDQLPAEPECIIIDGYVWLDRNQRPGLGAHLHAALGGKTPIIGVAKTPFKHDDWSQRVHRGRSRTPLYVSAVGMDPSRAADAIRSMHGPHRMPTLLKLADQVARQQG